MLRFALTIFTSAFLLFQVQPLIARYILPWFGGTPAVWSTCMLFFQLLLLGGYSYAHALNHFFKLRTQAVIHTIVLVLACLMLPIIPNDGLRPTGDESPVFQILLVLALTIGLPYFVVSTTGPLLQSWFAVTYPGRSPYRLFALSNFGSLVALLTYPFLFEPYLEQKKQAYSWSGGFVLFAILCGWCAIVLYRDRKLDDADSEGPKTSSDQPEKKVDTKYSNLQKPNALSFILWISLSMVPSILLLATTNQVCQEIAVVPFLWVVPLALYLITFIICFEAPYLYIRFVFYPFFGLSVLVAVMCLYMGVDAPMWIQAAGLFSAFFFGSMVCHGELACNKPDTRYLTLYYLAVSVGGALGGIFVVLCAPMIFTGSMAGYFELHVGLVLAICLTAIAFHARTDNKFFNYVPYYVSAGISAVIAILLCMPVIGHVQASVAADEEDGDKVEYRVRDFWGILTVKRTGSPDERNERLQLLNGRINHGNQYVDEAWRLYKTTYYCEGSGIAYAIDENPRRVRGETLRIGVIGLGTGTVAAWGEKDDLVRFYEINPEVQNVAENKFYYFREAREKNGAKVDVVLGDARIQMRRQLEEKNPQKFDVIAVDAFSSDAIPRHLLTLECVQLYEEHLRDRNKGIIAIHISNRFLDLEGICYRIGRELGYDPILIDCDPDPDKLHWGYDSTWVLFTKNEEFINNPEVSFSHSLWEFEWRRSNVENFLREELEVEVDLRLGGDILDQLGPDATPKPTQDELQKVLEGLDLDKYADQITDSEKKKKYLELLKKVRRTDKQFQVLWTDNFGSLWQVIRLEFDWKENKKEVKEWFKEWWGGVKMWWSGKEQDSTEDDE